MNKQTSDPADDPKTVGHSTAKRAIEILLSEDARYHCPTPTERAALRVGLAMRGKTLYGAAYDMVWMDRTVDLTDPDAISEAIDAIMICEIKSTNRPSVGSDLRGYCFQYHRR
ncbi:hypothetical protein [Erythrobacter sp. YT30]|uniref:hypothetical protein n=1 Tax=Erythrobacter sp. YT30 TaxID=1735012 RepID=UPI00076D54DD|nr:hypothetical protein [Erythrobacter sp. YT30]KWV92011.1 hypothetical protein AUC45_12720 [Erythrobacter sp. YT30]